MASRWRPYCSSASRPSAASHTTNPRWRNTVLSTAHARFVIDDQDAVGLRRRCGGDAALFHPPFFFEAQQCFQARGIKRFGQIQIKAGREAEPAMHLVRVPRDGNQQGFIKGGAPAELACQVAPAHPRHRQVQQQHVGPIGGSQFKGRRPGIGHAHVMSPELQEQRQAVGGIAAVVGDQHAQGSRAGGGNPDPFVVRRPAHDFIV